MISHALIAEAVQKLLWDFSRIKTGGMKGSEAEPRALTVP